MFIFIVALIYFAPTLNAVITFGKPIKRNWSAIFLLNLLLGWTLIGWVIALVWSETKDARLTS